MKVVEYTWKVSKLEIQIYKYFIFEYSTRVLLFSYTSVLLNTRSVFEQFVM